MRRLFVQTVCPLSHVKGTATPVVPMDVCVCVCVCVCCVCLAEDAPVAHVACSAFTRITLAAPASIAAPVKIVAPARIVGWKCNVTILAGAASVWGGYGQ